MNKRKIRILMKGGIKLGGGRRGGLGGTEDPGGEPGKVREEWEQNLSSALLPRLSLQVWRLEGCTDVSQPDPAPCVGNPGPVQPTTDLPPSPPRSSLPPPIPTAKFLSPLNSNSGHVVIPKGHVARSGDLLFSSSEHRERQ